MTQKHLPLIDAVETREARCQRVLSQVREVRRASELRTFDDAAERACDALERTAENPKGTSPAITL